MFDVHDYRKSVIISSERDIFDVFRNNEVIQYAIPDGWELVFPRLWMEVQTVASGSKIIEKPQYFLEGWWRRCSDGVLGYYVKINLHTGMVKEFRELPGNNTVIGERNSNAEVNYLQRCVVALKEGFSNKDAAVSLDALWQATVPAELRQLAMKKREEPTVGTYLLPLETLTFWNWNKLKELLLKRYDTTVEDIMDYIEYKKSGSDEFYVEPKLRDSAREKGMRFWRDGYDG